MAPREGIVMPLNESMHILHFESKFYFFFDFLSYNFFLLYVYVRRSVSCIQILLEEISILKLSPLKLEVKMGRSFIKIKKNVKVIFLKKYNFSQPKSLNFRFVGYDLILHLIIFFLPFKK